MNSNFYTYLLSQVNHSYRLNSGLPKCMYYCQPNKARHGFGTFTDNKIKSIEIFLNNDRFLDFIYYSDKLNCVIIDMKIIRISSASEDNLKMINFYYSYF